MIDDDVCLPEVRRELPVAGGLQPVTSITFYNTSSELLLIILRVLLHYEIINQEAQ